MKRDTDAPALERDTYTSHEVAQIFGRDIQVIRRWLREGRIEGAERIAGGHWVIWKGPFDAARGRGEKAA